MKEIPVASQSPAQVDQPPGDHQRIARRDRELLATIDRLSKLVHDSTTRWNAVIKEQNLSIPGIIFGGKPFIGDFLSARREFTPLIREALRRKFNFAQGSPEQLQQEDIFSVKVAGTSLSDIEQMQLPLAPHEIKRINKIFYQSRFTKRTPQQLRVIQSMIYLATQKMARADLNIVIPQNLEKLYSRLTDYFDYYVTLMTEFSLSAREEIGFVRNLRNGFPWLPAALGNYLPAKLGIIPASAIKIYHQHFDSPIYKFSFIGSLIKKLEEQSRNAVAKNILPGDLMPFVLFDPEADKKATGLLLQFYEDKKTDEATQMALYTRSNELLSSLDRYRKSLHRDIRSSPDRRLEIPLPAGHVVSKITLTSKDKRAFIFIANFRNGSTHLTFEIDKDGTYYGFPGNLIYDDPQVVDSFLVDALESVLQKARENHPGLEKPTQPPVITHQEERIVTERAFERPVYPPKPPKEAGKPTRSTPSPVGQFLARDKELPPRQEQPQRQFVVLHTRNQIRELVGRNSREKDLERIMRAIRNYECALVEPKTIDWSGGHVQSLRVGRYRIILRHLRNNFYAIEAIGHRDHIYKNYADRKV